MRPIAILAALPFLLLAGCASTPTQDPVAGPTAAPFTGHVEEWDGATWGHVCVDVAEGCFGQHSWEDGADEARVNVPAGAASAVLDVSWTAPDPRYTELRIYATRNGHEPVVAEGPSPLHIDVSGLVASGTGPIVVNGQVAGLADLPAKAHDEQWYHATLTFA